MTRHFYERAKALWSRQRLKDAELLGFGERDYAFALRLDAEQEHIRRKTELNRADKPLNLQSHDGTRL